MMALANADAVGVDVNPRLAAIYRDRSGRWGNGSVELIHGA
jgi:hypothetical protein